MPTFALQYTYRQKKRASTLRSLSQTEFEAAAVLIDKGLYREAVVHMYFTCFYLTQALLVHRVNAKVSHKALESMFHKEYGRSPVFPRRYVELHSALYLLRTSVDYRTVHVPSPSALKRRLRHLQGYVNFAARHVPSVETLDLLRDVYESNKGVVKDVSYDVYCPKTYSHHTRITFWQPPSYLAIYGPDELSRHAKGLLSALKVRRVSDYVVGVNSKLDQYRPLHLLMLDMDSFDSEVEAVLKSIGGILLKTGRGFHFIGNEVIDGQKKWSSLMTKLRRHPILKKCLDMAHIEISLKRGYATLRVTASSAKPVVPVFFKEL